MLTMPWAAVFAERLNPHDVARAAESVVMVVAAWAWWQSEPPPNARPPWERACRGALVALAVASTLAAPRLVYAALELSAFVLLGMVALVFARTPRAALQRELPPVLAVAGLLSMMMELPRWAFALADGRLPDPLDLGFMYMNARFLNHAQTMILPLLLVPLLLPQPRWVRAAAWVGLCGGLVMLWHAGGRATFLAITLFALMLPWLLPERAAELWRLYARAALGALAAYALLVLAPTWLLALPSSQHPHLVARLAGLSGGGRLFLLNRALQGMREHPWLGVGPMHFALGENPEAAHPHNVIAQLAMEWGLSATLLVLVLATLTAWRSLRGLATLTGNAQARTLLAIATLTALAGAFDALFSGTLVMPVSQLWWVLTLGVMLSVQAAGPPAGAPARWRLTVAAGVVALHAALSVVSCWNAIQLTGGAAAPKHFVAPRYWVDGFFF